MSRPTWSWWASGPRAPARPRRRPRPASPTRSTRCSATCIPGAHADHRPGAGHRCRRPGRGRAVPDLAWRPRLGPAGPPGAAPLVGEAVPVHAEGRPDPAPAGRRAGAPVRAAAPGGSGIRLGAAAGGATAFLDRVSVWRFLSPPPALLTGVLVDRAGERLCDESRYGAAIGDAIVRHSGQAWLLVDRVTLAEARRQVRRSTLWFQRLQAWYLLTFGAVSAPTLAGVAARAGVDPDGLATTLAAYNTAARDPAARDPAGKPPDLVRAQDQPPYSLIDCSVRPRLFYPAPVLTLGGLQVAPESGQVLRPDGSAIDGLYAAGRSAAGLCSRSYVSGLSLADCVFSGRRAGRHAASASASVATTQPSGHKLPGQA